MSLGFTVIVRILEPRFCGLMGFTGYVEMAFEVAPLDVGEWRSEWRKSAPLPQKLPYGEKSSDAVAQTRAALAPQVAQEWRACGLHPPHQSALPTVADTLDFPPSEGELQRLSSPKTLQDELEETREVLAEKATSLALLDQQLLPGRNEEAVIRDSIRGTHLRREGRPDGALILDLHRAAEREPLFEALDANTAEWGPMRTERARLNGEVKRLERQADRLVRDIDREAKKKRKVNANG